MYEGKQRGSERDSMPCVEVSGGGCTLQKNESEREILSKREMRI